MHRWRVLLIPLLTVAFAAAITAPATAASIQKDYYTLAECDGYPTADPVMRWTGMATHVDLPMQYTVYQLVGESWFEIGTNLIQVYGNTTDHSSNYRGTYEETLEGIGHFTGTYAIGAARTAVAVGVSDNGLMQKVHFTYDTSGYSLPDGATDCVIDHMVVMYR